MVSQNSGSIATRIQNLIDNIPTAVSGEIINLVEQEIQFAAEYTGKSIDTTNIPIQFQPAILDLSMSSVATVMAAQGADVSNIHLGPLSVAKGSSSNLQVVFMNMRERGLQKLREIGRNSRFFKAFG